MPNFLTNHGDISLALASVLLTVSGTIFYSPTSAPVFSVSRRQPK